MRGRLSRKEDLMENIVRRRQERDRSKEWEWSWRYRKWSLCTWLDLIRIEVVIM